jgi:FMN phosphatase YigB (HAD superfamily)
MRAADIDIPVEGTTMIRALLLDLGGTLIDADRHVFPGVNDALTAFRNLKAADGTPLVTCLVSDYTMPEPRTPEKITEAFAEYLGILDGIGLRGFFEPVDERVTLSTNVGVSKPDAKVFEAALKRANLDAALTEALFITEDAGHVAAARTLGMQALQFGVDFKKWSQAPHLVEAALV